jgi:hypothetical protein
VDDASGSLADFLEAHRGLVSALSLFTTLVAFSGNLAWGPEFRAILSGLFLGVTLVLWLEFWRKLSAELRGPGLIYGKEFGALVAAALGVLAFAWLVEFRSLWIEALPLVLALVVGWRLFGPLERGVAALLRDPAPTAARGRLYRAATLISLGIVAVVILAIAWAIASPVKTTLVAATDGLEALLRAVLPGGPHAQPAATPTPPPPSPPAGS